MMKKALIGLIAAAAMTSCVKRQEVTTDQNSNLGKGTITGTIIAKSDYVADTLANGAGAKWELGTKGVEGLSVTATWSTQDLDPDGINAEGMSTTTTTDADGNYTLSIDATGQGTDVDVTIGGTVSMDVTHADDSRTTSVKDTNDVITSYNVITESFTFHADSLGSKTYSVNGLVSGQTVVRAEERIEAEEIADFNDGGNSNDNL